MFYVAADVSRYDYGSSDTVVTGTFGVLPIDGLRITTSVTDDGYDANASVKYVTAIGSVNYLNVEGTYQDDDLDDYLSIGADFYIDRTFSFGGRYEVFYGVDVFSLCLRKFFTIDISGERALRDRDCGIGILIGAAMCFLMISPC